MVPDVVVKSVAKTGSIVVEVVAARLPVLAASL